MDVDRAEVSRPPTLMERVEILERRLKDMHSRQEKFDRWLDHERTRLDGVLGSEPREPEPELAKW